MEYEIYRTDELTHWGVKGMRWGVRRYQNKDGTLTNLGERRYARDAREKGYSKQDESGTYYKTNKKGKNRENLDIDANRYVKEDYGRTKRVAEESSTMTNKLKKLNDDTLRYRKVKPMDLSNMTDKEMRDQINRAMLERQYDDMFNPQKASKGREYVSQTLDITGTVLGIGASALGIALAIKELKG